MRILHIFRTPVGGLFRHVRDLVRGQTALGHEVGIICDSTTGGRTAASLLDAVAPHCKLSVQRVPISRLPGWGDLSAARLIGARAGEQRPDILHGHGAKGGLYARLAARKLGLPSVYTPHGGTLHYEWRSPQGAVYLSVEKALRAIGSGFLFVCDFERAAFDRKIGIGGKPNRVVYNGLWPEEFAAVPSSPDATDILYIGELRLLKGTDVLIDAIALLNRDRRVSATIVGDGEDRASFEAQAASLGLQQMVRFTGQMPARQALPLGRIFVMPSRAESFPYVILEVAAAGLPMIASRVGGVPEILPADSTVASGNAKALATAIGRMVDDLKAAQTAATSLQSAVRNRFDATVMSSEICAFYTHLTAS